MPTAGETVPSPTHSPVQKQAKLDAGENGEHSAQGRTILKFAKLTEHAFTPTRGSKLAAGYDVYSAYDYVIEPKGKILAKTDIQIALPDGCYGRVAPRSGLAHKHFIDVGAGVIDQDYRGNVGVVMFNFSDKEFKVQKGDRIAQLILERIYLPDLVELKTLDDTERGEVFSLTIKTQGQKFYITEGDELTLECTIDNRDDEFDPFLHLIEWIKWQDDTQRQAGGFQYATHKQLKEPFLSATPDRYLPPTIDDQVTPPKQVTSTVRITQVRKEDSGSYQCLVRSIGEQVIHEVFVIQEIEWVRLFSYEDASDPPESMDGAFSSDGVVRFDKEEGGFLSCVVKRAYPMPVLRIEVDDMIRTSFFSLNETCVLTGNRPGLQSPQCSVMRSRSAYRPSTDDVGKTLSCTASLETDAATLQTKRAQAKIEIVGEPEAVDGHCRRLQVAQAGNAQAVLTCRFFSNPLYSSASWIIADNIALSDGQQKDDYSTTIEVINESRSIYEAHLEIRNVKERHFKTYELVVENSYGQPLRKTVILEEGGKKDATTGASTAMTSLTVTLLMLLLSLALTAS